jgi:hypothetical protein
LAPPKQKKKRYFTIDHENAIIAYTSTDDIKVRTDLYIIYIQPAFNEMVDKIVYTYKFTNLPNIDYLKDECKIWLTTILEKYNPDTGSKAFSYFSVITKNWFIAKVKKNSKRTKKEVQYDDLPLNLEEEYLSVENNYIRRREQEEFWQHLQKEIDSWKKLKLKENERRVLQAIDILFENAQEIEIFNKKAIYLYVREITGLNTKQVVNNLNKIRIKYRVFRKQWQNEIK